MRRETRASISVGQMSAAWRPRVFLATVLLALTVLVLFALKLAVGDYNLPLGAVWNVLLGEGETTEKLVVLKWRMPRAATAVGVGATLGLSGALMQSVTRNPLASPDILGITMGASAAAVTVIVIGKGSASVVTSWIGGLGISTAAAVGAMASALVIWLLAFRRNVDSFRLVLFGVIINALLQAYVSYLLIRADLRDAQAATVWLTGSLNAANWHTATPVFVLLGVFIPVIAWISYQFKAMELGPDFATGLGQNPRRNQLTFIACSAVLAAVAVAAAGPIGFVAFVAPQVALRLCAVSSPPLTASALTGALLVTASDLVTTHALPVALPVGLLTAVLGGSFLIYVLIQNNRRNSI